MVSIFCFSLNVIKGIVKNYETMKRDASKKLDTYVEDRSAYMEIQLIPITQNGHAELTEI